MFVYSFLRKNLTKNIWNQKILKQYFILYSMIPALMQILSYSKVWNRRSPLNKCSSHLLKILTSEFWFQFTSIKAFLYYFRLFFLQFFQKLINAPIRLFRTLDYIILLSLHLFATYFISSCIFIHFWKTFIPVRLFDSQDNFSTY
jgi:hypothetical protein